jgi:hypothetical protein
LFPVFLEKLHAKSFQIMGSHGLLYHGHGTTRKEREGVGGYIKTNIYVNEIDITVIRYNIFTEYFKNLVKP